MFGNGLEISEIQKKNIGIKSYMVTVALKQLLDDALFWFQNNTYPQDEMAIRFKHRLVCIHCFPNGNGRHSRLIADLIVTKLYNANYFTWGKNNLVQSNETRTNYIKALKLAENQEYSALIEFARI